MEERNKKSKKKTVSFFCCGSGSSKKEKFRISAENELNSSKNSNLKPVDNISNDEIKLNNSNIEKNDKNKVAQVNRTKDISTINNDLNNTSKSFAPVQVKNELDTLNKFQKVSLTARSTNSEAASTKRIFQDATLKEKEKNNEILNLELQKEERPSNLEKKELKKLDKFIINSKFSSKKLNSNSKDLISVREGVDFTFKKSTIDTRSEFKRDSHKVISNSHYQTNPINNNDILEFLNNRDAFKKSMITVIDNDSSNDNETIFNSLKISKRNSIDFNSGNMDSHDSNTKNSPFAIAEINNIDKSKQSNNIGEENMDDEFTANENDNIYLDNQSVISSKIVSHINTPKMMSNIKNSIDQSFALSMYSKSEINSRLDSNNILLTENNNVFFPNINAEDTEFEITNENSDRFSKFIETPKSSNLQFSSSLKNITINNNIQLSNQNPNLKDINHKLLRKENEAKKLQEKIQRLVKESHNVDEENKRYIRRLEKEEAEGEMLRHMLNFLTTNA